ncbi:hypothetical protein EDB84DRAFT_1457282, partial [Lactarius hengduanensis]
MAPCTVRPLLLTVIGLVTLGIFFQAPSFGIGALYYRDPYSSPVASLTARLHEETRYAATLKARQGLIKKHGLIFDLGSRYPATGSYSTQYVRDFFIPSFQCPHHAERIGVLGDGGKWAALLERAPGCEVWGYDLTCAQFGPEIENIPSLKDTCALLPVDARHRNAHGPEDSPKYYTLDALMKLNGHTFIDPVSSTTLPIGQLQIELHARDDYGNFDFFHDRCAALEAAGMRPFLTKSNLVYVNYNTGGCR